VGTADILAGGRGGLLRRPPTGEEGFTESDEDVQTGDALQGRTSGEPSAGVSRTPAGPHLVQIREGRVEATYPLSGKGLTIGRSPRSDVVLADERVSKNHARIVLSRDEAVISDLGSRNGTRVNERKIRAHALTSGDLIRVGRVCFLFIWRDVPAERDERSAVGWLVVDGGEKPRTKLPVTEAPLLVGSSPEADLVVPERKAPAFMAQVLAVPTGAQITNLCSEWPHCSLLGDGCQMRFGSLEVRYTQADHTDLQPAGLTPVEAAPAGPSLDEVERALAARTQTMGDESLFRVLTEEVERSEREVVLRRKPTPRPQPTVPPHRAGGCRLTATTGPVKGLTFTATERTLIVGRHGQCDVRLDDPRVSRRHARLVRSEGDLFIEDLDSANGVYVNGKRVRRKPLQPGDVVAIGSSQFLVHL